MKTIKKNVDENNLFYAFRDLGVIEIVLKNNFIFFKKDNNRTGKYV